jgi:hypothetical protein
MLLHRGFSPFFEYVPNLEHDVKSGEHGDEGHASGQEPVWLVHFVLMQDMLYTNLL